MLPALHVKRNLTKRSYRRAQHRHDTRDLSKRRLASLNWLAGYRGPSALSLKHEPYRSPERCNVALKARPGASSHVTSRCKHAQRFGSCCPVTATSFRPERVPLPEDISTCPSIWEVVLESVVALLNEYQQRMLKKDVVRGDAMLRREPSMDPCLKSTRRPITLSFLVSASTHWFALV